MQDWNGKMADLSLLVFGDGILAENKSVAFFTLSRVQRRRPSVLEGLVSLNSYDVRQRIRLVLNL